MNLVHTCCSTIVVKSKVSKYIHNSKYILQKSDFRHLGHNQWSPRFGKVISCRLEGRIICDVVFTFAAGCLILETKLFVLQVKPSERPQIVTATEK